MQARILNLPKIPDDRGNITFIEGEKHVPFKIARTYYIYDVPGGETRGAHAYKEAQEFIVAISGSFDVIVDDGTESKVFTLNRSYFGLYLPPLTWREPTNFSSNSLCMVLSSSIYTPEDYIRDYGNYKELIRKQ